MTCRSISRIATLVASLYRYRVQCVPSGGTFLIRFFHDASKTD